MNINDGGANNFENDFVRNLYTLLLKNIVLNKKYAVSLYVWAENIVLLRSRDLFENIIKEVVFLFFPHEGCQ